MENTPGIHFISFLLNLNRLNGEFKNLSKLLIQRTPLSKKQVFENLYWNVSFGNNRKDSRV
jgi:hypothetical protein